LYSIDDDDDDDTEAIDQEEDNVPMEEEDNTEASETTSDQGDQIGEFWSGINYKVDKYSVRVVGQKNNFRAQNSFNLSKIMR